MSSIASALRTDLQNRAIQCKNLADSFRVEIVEKAKEIVDD